MAISTKTTITIGGENLSRFSELTIHQKVNAHHTFSLVQPMPKEFVSEGIEKSQSYIGQNIKIEINPNNMKTDSGLIFNGIITQAQLERSAGGAGKIIISGYSPTILLDGKNHMQSFTAKTISDIVKETAGKHADSLKLATNLKKDTNQAYTVQYNESDFGFLTRLAQKKGAWFYYNGQELHFGKPSKNKTFTLEYGRSLHSFTIGMHAQPMNFEYIGYDASSADAKNATSNDAGYEAKGISKSVFDASKKIFADTNTTLYSNPIEEGSAQTHLSDRIKTQTEGKGANLVTARGESDETGLRIGDVMVINESAFTATGNSVDSVKEQNFGGYILTEITHTCDETGKYENNFTAVPQEAETPHYTNIHKTPKADTQPAKVIDNNDPKGLGRVQVQMDWQKNSGENTPWLRMTNPHAGGGKGMYFIPEVGEEVLVAFENNNAEKPYIQGAMYNGNESSSYHTAGNDQKVIQTRSGTKVIMNDAAGSIFIEDPSGNTWMMDGKGNINVNAPNDITINAGGNISITAGQNINSSATLNIMESAGVDKSSSVGMMHNMFVGGDSFVNVTGKLTEHISGDVESYTEKERTDISKGKMVSQSEGVHEHHSQKEVKHNSQEKTKMF
jgi:type VI secretion system secreted protein VgrG